MTIKIGFGEDSHAFDFNNDSKELILGGLSFKNETPLKGNSDSDVILHAITRAISSITGIQILGKTADNLCKKGIKDSKYYLQLATNNIKEYNIDHIAISIEAKKPKLANKIPELTKNITELLNLSKSNIGITAHSGDRLSDVGKGLGIKVSVIITCSKQKY